MNKDNIIQANVWDDTVGGLYQYNLGSRLFRWLGLEFTIPHPFLLYDENMKMTYQLKLDMFIREFHVPKIAQNLNFEYV